MSDRPHLHVAGEKRKGTISIPTGVLHTVRNSPGRYACTVKANAGPGSGFPGEPDYIADFADDTFISPQRTRALRNLDANCRAAAKAEMRRRLRFVTISRRAQDAGSDRFAGRRVSGSSSHSKANPQTATAARPKNATLRPK